MPSADEFAHLIKQHAQQQIQEQRPFAFGHISSYDPPTGRCRAIIPSLMGEDGTPVLTPWMKLGTAFSGNGYGLQACPKGGASFANPTAGEQILVCIVDSEFGTALAGVMLFNDTSPPPFPSMTPGEVGLQSASGSFVYLHQDNSFEINTTHGNGVVNVRSGSGQINLTTTGKCVVTASEVDLPELTVVTGNLTVSGNLQLGGTILGQTGGVYAGNITTSGSVTAGQGGADRVGLQTHLHPGVATGAGSTAAPTPGT